MWWALLLVLEPRIARAEAPVDDDASDPGVTPSNPGRPVSVMELEGGLTLLVEPIPGTGAVGSFLYLPGGAGQDPIDAPGLAHLVEHLAFTGTAGAPGTSWDGAFTAAGGWTNAWTDSHGIGLFAEVPAGAASLLIALEVDRLRNLSPAPAEVRAQLGVIEAERRSAGPRPDAVISALLWPSGHALHPDPMGSPRALSGLPYLRLVEAARMRMTPRGAVWAIVGDVDADRVREQVSSQLGEDASADGAEGTSPVASAPRLDAVPAATPSVRRAWTYDAVARRARTRAWAVPGTTAPEAAALRLIARMIGARLHLGPDGGTLTLSCADGQAVLRRLRRIGPGPGALDDLRATSRMQHADALRNLTTRAETLALCQSWTGDHACDADARSQEDRVTALDLRDVARNWLPERRALLFTQVPRGAPAFGRVGRRVVPPQEGDLVSTEPFDASSDTAPSSCQICSDHPVEPARVPGRPAVTPVYNAPPVTVDVAEVSASFLDTRAAVVVALSPAAPLDPAQRLLAESMLQRGARSAPPGARVRVGCGATRCRVLVEALPAMVVDSTVSALGGLVDVRPPGVGWWWRERRSATRWTRMAPRGQLTATEAALERLVLADGHPLRERSPPASSSELRPAGWRSVQERLRTSQVHVALVGHVETDAAATLGAAISRMLAVEGTSIAPETEAQQDCVKASRARSLGIVDPRAPASRHELAPRVDPARVVIVDIPGTDVVELRVAWAAPGGGDADAEPLALAARAWGEDATAVLDRTLRGRLGVTYGVRADVRDLGGGSLLVVSGAFAPTDLGVALPALRELLSDPRLPREDVVGRAQASLREAWAARRSSMEVASMVSDAHMLGRSMEAHWRYIETFQNVSQADVERALRAVVSGPSVWVISGDAGPIEDALITAGLPTDAVWSAERAVHGPR